MMSISFCNWIQDHYTPDQPEIIDLKVQFYNVKRFTVEQNEIELDDDQILDVKLHPLPNEQSQIQFVIQGEEIVRSIWIETDCVENILP